MVQNDKPTLRQQIAAAINRLALAIGGISGVRPNLADGSPIWRAATVGPGITDQPRAVAIKERQRALKGYRENSTLYRAVELKTDHIIGDEGIRPGSPSPELERFLLRFWDHPENQMGERLPVLISGLLISGDLFILLFTDGSTGATYLRPLPYEMVQEIVPSATDFEKEVAYVIAAGDGTMKRYPAYGDDLEPAAESIGASDYHLLPDSSPLWAKVLRGGLCSSSSTSLNSVVGANFELITFTYRSMALLAWPLSV